jgi:hypothetical protein
LLVRKRRLSMPGLGERLARRGLHRSRSRRPVHRRRERVSERRHSTPTHPRCVAQLANGLRRVVHKTWHHVQRIQSQILQGVRNVVVEKS